MADDFYGLPVRSITNGLIRLDVLEGAGPRIVRLIAGAEGDNLLAEVPNKSWETPWGQFFIRGGHRLWHAPEAFPRTYQPDNEGMTIEEIADGLILRRPAEPGTGIAKVVTITLRQGRAAATIRHELRNDGVWPVELGPWAITQMRIGGMAILPLGDPNPPSGTLLPNRQITYWPYTKVNDLRIMLNDDYLLVEAVPNMPPSKVGAFGRIGWIAYLLDDTLLVKRHTPRPGLPHPDMGCNIEAYFDQNNLELETLAPLELLEPGQSAVHIEEWELHTGVKADVSIEGVRLLVQQLGL